MYSGEDSSGDPLGGTNQFLNWAMGQNSFSVNKDQVDWAALAQQWIMMKESCSNYVNTTNIVNNTAITQQPIVINSSFEEKGEAPMEVVKEDEVPSNATTSIQGTCINSSGMFVPEAQHVWQSGWCQPNQTQMCGNWSTWDDSTSNPVQVPGMQTINVFKDKQNIIPMKNGEIDPVKIPQMDAAKKKTLPAWIREGLEKMEREKQKQLERQKRESTVPLVESNKSEEIKNIIKTENLLQDSEQSDVEEKLEQERKEDNIPEAVPAKVEKSREELIEETMLVVRKSLTELLLEVTNEEIVNIAQECLKRYKTKASSAQVVRKSAISSITCKLGLGAYADSASENSESEGSDTDNGIDSEEEIKESIRIRQNAFKAIAREIELNIIQQEDKTSKDDKELIGKESCESSTKVYDKDTGETQPEKKSSNNGKRIRERTSRFNSIKDAKQKNNCYIVQTSTVQSSSSTITATSTSGNYDYEKRKLNSARQKRYSYSSNSSSDSNYSDKRKHHSTSSNNNKHKSSNSRRDKLYNRNNSGRYENSNRGSSDSDDQYEKSNRRRKHSKSHSRDRSRSRSRSRSRNSKRSERRY